MLLDNNIPRAVHGSYQSVELFGLDFVGSDRIWSDAANLTENLWTSVADKK